MKYFAYGSNMLVQRVGARVGEVSVLGSTALCGHRLMFHKRGSDGSGKCDAWRTRFATDQVHGVVFELEPEQKTLLDHHEGPGYAVRWVNVRLAGRSVRVFAYLALHGHVQAGLAPYSWYKALVLAGSMEHGFPASYQAAIAAVSAAPDPDGGRRERHHEILRRSRYSHLLGETDRDAAV